MRIELLFPEICNLYGDLWNIDFLRKSYPDIEIVETSLKDEPVFAKDRPDLIYMGTMTENAQIMVVEKLMPYRLRTQKLIDEGANFLVTGNALEVFGKKIKDKNGTETACLSIFDTVAERDMMDRFNSLYLGEFEDMKIVGFKSQFTHSRWEVPKEEVSGLFVTKRGSGLNPDINEEGIKVNNFMATYVTGPLLVLNPPFAKYVLEKCGITNPSLAFEAEAMAAYNARVTEYSDPGTGFYY